ncbi:hypothetical protein RFI_07628 [Reticulomyxa filosa]|uniref:Uncharacterized protein n=1 Tax=Reticulomyxa filosa TaxID=46433 RepID=X6NW44_RETFI|nr:hypothetical protein RFI_07628 [Reticulomyxa filosa]|eukprot:ETO29492.1 hypothetical protein RFI_07628 [Reticulomyxa filosa]
MENDFVNIPVIFDEQEVVLKLIGCPPHLVMQSSQMALEFWDTQRVLQRKLYSLYYQDMKKKRDEAKKELEQVKGAIENKSLQSKNEHQLLLKQLQNAEVLLFFLCYFDLLFSPYDFVTIQSLQADIREKERQCDKYRMIFALFYCYCCCWERTKCNSWDRFTIEKMYRTVRGSGQKGDKSVPSSPASSARVHPNNETLSQPASNFNSRPFYPTAPPKPQQQYVLLFMFSFT